LINPRPRNARARWKNAEEISCEFPQSKRSDGERRRESRMSIELSHAHSLCAALGEREPKRASTPVATSQRDRRGALAGAARTCAESLERLCFLHISANRRLDAARRCKPSAARLTTSRSGAKRM